MKNHTNVQRNMFQIRAFKAFFKAACIDGHTTECSFASAIAGSSDETVDALLEKDSSVIIKWWNR